MQLPTLRGLREGRDHRQPDVQGVPIDPASLGSVYALGPVIQGCNNCCRTFQQHVLATVGHVLGIVWQCVV